MLSSVIARIVGVCTRNAWRVVAVGLLLAMASGFYVARHFAINSDINTLLSSDLGWRKRELAFERAFHRFELIYVVVEAPTPELTGQATAALTQALAKNKERFREVTQPGGGEFFARNGLLFQSPDELKRSLAPLVQAEPLIHDLAIDPSLRGLISGLEDGLIGIQSKRIALNDFTRVFDMASDTMEKVISGEPASFSWRVLVEGHPATPSELRGFIEVRPVLDYSAIEPGHAATQTLRNVAAAIAPKFQATVRL
ncbi:MAG: MMPL family transporter, partial [Terriglobia bacterium]